MSEPRNMRITHTTSESQYAQYALHVTHIKNRVTVELLLGLLSMGVGDNIRRIRKAKKWTILELATRIGSDVGNLSRLERNKQGYTDELLRKLAAALECNVTDFFADAGNAVPIGPNNYDMPLISWVKAGAWCESPDQFAPGDAEDWLPRPKGAGPRAFALRVEGDSMTSQFPGQRSYPAGSIIYVDPDREVTNGCRVVARIPSNGEYTFKVYTEDAGKRYLKPINPQYPLIDISEETHICGVVIGSYLPE